jgi:hypothetical protein
MITDTNANPGASPADALVLTANVTTDDSRHSADGGTFDIVAPSESPFADTVTTAEAIRIYEEAGFPRSDRSLQRYCATGQVRAHKSYDDHGMVFYRIERASIAAHIQTIKTTRPQYPARAPQYQPLSADTSLPPASGMGSPSSQRGVAFAQQMMGQTLAAMTGERDVLREQLRKKDEQIAALNEHVIASSRVIGGLQDMLKHITNFLPLPPRNQ